jgi:hypothetical protein
LIIRGDCLIAVRHISRLPPALFALTIYDQVENEDGWRSQVSCKSYHHRVSLPVTNIDPQLCPATFTRPQHVGRHLRSHTGDRPYECKECPLRFARRYVPISFTSPTFPPTLPFIEPTRSRSFHQPKHDQSLTSLVTSSLVMSTRRIDPLKREQSQRRSQRKERENHCPRPPVRLQTRVVVLALEKDQAKCISIPGMESSPSQVHIRARPRGGHLSVRRLTFKLRHYSPTIRYSTGHPLPCPQTLLESTA